MTDAGMSFFKAAIYMIDALVGRISVFVDGCRCYIDFKVILPKEYTLKEWLESIVQ